MALLKEEYLIQGLLIPKFTVVHQEKDNYKVVPLEISRAAIQLAQLSCGMGQTSPVYKENRMYVTVTYATKQTNYEVGRTLTHVSLGGQNILDLYMINLESKTKRNLFILKPGVDIVNDLEF